MASTTKIFNESNVSSTTQLSSTAKSGSAYARLIESLHFSYFGLISMTILIGSCLGGITAMYVLKDNAPIWQLCINIYLTMASNIAAIGQAPTKWVVNTFLISVLANIVLLLAHVL